jgi:peptide deformylase
LALERVNMRGVGELDIVSPKDPVLNLVAETVGEGELGSAYIQGVISRMQQIAAGKGHGAEDTRQVVGLAAPQIGVSRRIVLIDVASDGSRGAQDLRAFINPRIMRYSTEVGSGREGCWSTGNICGNVERSVEVVLEAVDVQGSWVKQTFAGFTARIVQHEVDHLDGIRFPDRIDDDSRLHWVEPTDFERYRRDWAHWPQTCPREAWEALKRG